MGFSVMLWGAEKLVPAEYWCPYGSYISWQFLGVYKAVTGSMFRSFHENSLAWLLNTGQFYVKVWPWH